MPALVDATWHTGPGQETIDKGKAHVHMKKWFFKGRQQKPFSGLINSAVGSIRLCFGDDEWVDLHFQDKDAASIFASECQKILGKRELVSNPMTFDVKDGFPQDRITNNTASRRKSIAHDFERLSSQNCLPKAVYASSSTSWEVKRQSMDRKPATFGGAPTIADTPSRVSEAKKPAMDMSDDRKRSIDGTCATDVGTSVGMEIVSHDTVRESKRRSIDSKCAGVGETPEKLGKFHYTTCPRRAWEPRRGPLSVEPRTSIAPQSSSSYHGYRSSLTFGLVNLGNTCYLNAIMQAFSSLREFVTDLAAMTDILPKCQDGELYRCTLDTLMQMSRSCATDGPLCPSKLREQIALAAPMFRGNGQQDAHEFFLEFVNQVHDELLGVRNAWLQVGPEGKEDQATLATQLHFDSEVQKRLVCIQCQESREITERFRDYSVDFNAFTNTDSCLLSNMVATYFDSELLDHKCEKCGAAAANQDKMMTSPPRVLVLHLKRFIPNLEKQRYDKQHQNVEIPTWLDLNTCLTGADVASSERTKTSASLPCPSPPRLPARPLASTSMVDNLTARNERLQEDNVACITPSKAAATNALVGLQREQHAANSTWSESVTGQTPALWYKLRAVVAHEGNSPHSGHYTCYACNDKDTWKFYNDSIVQELPFGWEPQRELGRKAYIVFYVMQNQKNKDLLA